MVRLLGALVVVCLLIAGVGYIRGWFHADVHTDHGQGTVNVTVDRDKLEKDKEAARQEVQRMEHQ